MIHEILKYENIFILMKKMGKHCSQTAFISPTMFRKYCEGVGEEGDLGNLIQTFIFGLKYFLFTASPNKDFEIAILQDKDITSVNKTFHISAKTKNSNFSRSNSNFSILTPTFSLDGFYDSCFQNPSENSDIFCKYPPVIKYS